MEARKLPEFNDLITSEYIVEKCKEEIKRIYKDSEHENPIFSGFYKGRRCACHERIYRDFLYTLEKNGLNELDVIGVSMSSLNTGAKEKLQKIITDTALGLLRADYHYKFEKEW